MPDHLDDFMHSLFHTPDNKLNADDRERLHRLLDLAISTGRFWLAFWHWSNGTITLFQEASTSWEPADDERLIPMLEKTIKEEQERRRRRSEPPNPTSLGPFPPYPSPS